jgi:hypothetical protein
MKVRHLEREKAEQAGQLEQCRVQAEQLKAQIQALSALPEGEKKNLYALKAVRIVRLTNFHDEDKDGKREKLIVYLEPIDQDGDAFKAAGAVNVQLWDLNEPAAQALLGQWQIAPRELHKLWFNALITASYRLIFAAPVTIETLARPLTVKVTFTDYLTGETFTAQRVIKPRVD